MGFDVAKTGVGRIGFVGFPSVGKSTLMSKLTGTHSEVAAYEFTTLTTVPGVVQYNGAKLQILDLPGIIEGAKDGKGRGMCKTNEKTKNMYSNTTGRKEFGATLTTFRTNTG